MGAKKYARAWPSDLENKSDFNNKGEGAASLPLAFIKDKKKMADKNFIVTIEKDNDGTFIAYNVDESPYTLIGRGGTVKEAKADFMNSIQEVKVIEEEREGAAAPILSAAPVFKFDLSSLFEYYSMLNVSAFARYLGINETLMRQYKKGNTYISDAQLQKIENGIHQLGTDFLGLRLV